MNAASPVPERTQVIATAAILAAGEWLDRRRTFDVATGEGQR